MEKILPLEVPGEVQDWLKVVRKNNRKYQAASLMEKRVMLARDVLSALQAGRYRARRGVYQPPVYRSTSAQNSLPAVMNRWGGECEVCAKGALFVSRLDRLKGIPVCVLDGSDLSHRVPEFSKREMARIEALFEGSEAFLRKEPLESSWHISEYREALYAKYNRRARKLSSAEWILREIMQNIVKNKGSLVIPDLEEPLGVMIE